MNDESNLGNGSWNNDVSRRKFLKRSGGATMAALVTWHMSGLVSRADSEAATGDSSTSNSVVEFEVTSALNISVTSEKQFWEKFNDAKNSGKIKDMKWSVPIANPVVLDGTIISSPPGAKVDFTWGNFKLPVGKYKIKVYKTK